VPIQPGTEIPLCAYDFGEAGELGLFRPKKFLLSPDLRKKYPHCLNGGAAWRPLPENFRRIESMADYTRPCENNAAHPKPRKWFPGDTFPRGRDQTLLPDSGGNRELPSLPIPQPLFPRRTRPQLAPRRAQK